MNATTVFRFTFDPEFCGDCDPFVGEPVSTLELAKGQLSVIADYTLHLHECSLMPDHSNYGFVESREAGGRWEQVGEDDL